MTDSTPRVQDFLSLLAQAEDLLAQATATRTDLLSSEWYVRATIWRDRVRNFTDTLNRSHGMLRRLVLEAIGSASACWANPAGAGQFDSDRASLIGETLLSELHEYMNSLPLVRQLPDFSGLEDNDASEMLARAIYVISAAVDSEVSGANPDWDAAPDPVKTVLRETSRQLVNSGLVTLAVANDPVDEEPANYGRFLPPNIPMPPGFHSDSEAHR